MKKVIFCLQTMVRGGVEKELITVLKHLDQSSYDVTVLVLYTDDKAILKEIPSWVKIKSLEIDRDYYCGPTPAIITRRIRSGHLLEAVSLSLKYLFRIGTTASNQSIRDIPELQEGYDTAVCYHIHSPLMLKYTAEKIRAKRKVGWIHNDFRNSHFPINRLTEILKAYDQFAAVSEDVADEFRELCPCFSDKVAVVHNIADQEEIRRKAKLIPSSAPFFLEERTRILTVGRFTEQKGFDLAVESARILKEKGCSFCWYFIGWGEEENVLRKMIKAEKLNDCVIILGRKDNPYPYMDQCDLYVQPSRHEAYAMTILEAEALAKPIICTDFAGAEEQIRNGVTGYIVPVGDTIILSERISFLISSPAERTRLSDNLKKKPEENDLAKIIKVIEG